MRLPDFEYISPGNLDEALDALARAGDDGAVLAGGTDLLVRMKQGLAGPRLLVSLKNIEGLSYVRREENALKIGARTSLADILCSDEAGGFFPALARAAKSVGAFSLQRHQGTIGGNICQDNRCKYYNQSAFFRSARQACHKAGGKICYARDGSDRCRSTCRSDLGPVLMALDARAVLTGKDGQRTVSVEDFYASEGENPIAVAPHELLTEIQIPFPEKKPGNAYHRLAFRSAIDYPIVCAAVSLEASDGNVSKARLTVGAVGSAPLLLLSASKRLEGPWSPEKIGEAAKMAMDTASAFAVDNVAAPVEYRIQMIAVMAKRAIEEAAGMALGKV
ncbi:conserved hypothetical protein [Candidatus Desulfarcum epimagneticum]|uniref:FAD-binding PCMH-type domain-containing protein n=1 Tax=uncultured Desulfobacteraceae bacterium TaxID=218296 RepID=A0A484HEJ1_9BACT|nr:conserved hypothetical protein [uncultured Desulfobacteraceae bacterium]